MPYLTVEGRQYWAGRYQYQGKGDLLVFSDQWQEGLSADRVRMLRVSSGRLAEFYRAFLRETMGRPRDLGRDEIDAISKALRAWNHRHRVKYHSPRGLQLLRTGTGIAEANFRPGQEEAIQHVVENRGRLLVVERTGWGKSSVYFIATMLLREAGRGPALLVSPLLSLMRNQIAAAERMGVRAARITSDNRDEWREVEEALDRDEVDILLIAPERLANERFRHRVLSGIADRISLLVIDECHCISDWGHDFRPDYQLIERAARALPPNMRLLATTATANNRVMDDLREVLGQDLRVQRGPLARPSLSLQTVYLPRQSQRLAWLAEQVPRISGHGIIYTLTVRDAEQVADWLRSRWRRGRSIYWANGSVEERERLEQALLENQVKALVATVALGMGFDKPDLGFVIHYQAPGSVVAYYQQVGRAGRALERACGSPAQRRRGNRHHRPLHRHSVPHARGGGTSGRSAGGGS